MQITAWGGGAGGRRPRRVLPWWGRARSRGRETWRPPPAGCIPKAAGRRLAGLVALRPLATCEEDEEGVGPWFSLPARSPTECSSGGLPGWARGWLSVCFFGSLPLQGWSRREAVYITYMHAHAHGRTHTCMLTRHGCGRTHTHLRLARRSLRSPTRPAGPPRRQHERFERPQHLERVDFGGSSRSRCAT